MDMNSPTTEPTDYVEYDEHCDRDATCDYCGGDGGDPMNDYCTECPECHGEGYKWWL